SGNVNYLTGTALYRINTTSDNFKQITYKGYINNVDSLITEFEKNWIVLMLTLIQSISIFVENDKLIHNDLLYSAPLLLYSSLMVPDSYIDNDSGRKSFELFKKSYNGVNGHKNLDTNMIVSYSNEYRSYNALKDNLSKTVLSVVGRLKIGSKKSLTSLHDFNDQLNNIEEKYAKKRTVSRKQVRINPLLAASFSKAPNGDTQSLNN
ncbi:29668_t:CDS:2, partial [Racocetra persica]